MRTTLVMLVLALLATGACHDTEPAGIGSTLENKWLPLDANEPMAGKTLDEWAVEWSRWGYAQTTCQSPVTDIDGSQCGLYQDEESPVFFLTFGPSEALRTECEIPSDKGILVPIVTFEIDNVGFDPPLTDEELSQSADEALTSMRDLTLVVDGSEVAVDEERSVGPIRYKAHLGPAPNYYSCRSIKGFEDVDLDPVHVTGYFALLPPAPPGEHTIRFGGVQDLSGASLESVANTRFRVRGASDE